MIATTRRHCVCSFAAPASFAVLLSLAGCAAWPQADSPARDESVGLARTLDAAEPETEVETEVTELTLVDETTELGSPAPFPRPGRPRTSIPASSNNTRVQVPVIDVAATPQWEEAGRSLEGRPVEAIQFGRQADRRVLVIASLAGSDPESVRFVDRLATRLSRIDEFGNGTTDVAALLIRSPNPDGLAGHFSTNSQGVELNRNFPSPRFPITRTTRTGPEPGSEPETQAIMQLLTDFRPTHLVHVRPGSGSELLLLCENQNLRPITEQCVDVSINVACHDGDFKAGSIEEYCRGQWNTDIMTVYLPGERSMADSDELLRGVARACLSVELPEVAAEDANSLAAQQASTTETRNPDGDNGYVEMLPPPVTHADSPQDSRYYELPPPPE